ncbi:hypothetical protein GCM10022209_56710 [Chitinophaga oryziterrae]
MLAKRLKRLPLHIYEENYRLPEAAWSDKNHGITGIKDHLPKFNEGMAS